MEIKTLDEQAAVQALAALAQPLRLRVFRALVVAGPQGLTPGDLALQLDVANTTLSFHLKELMHAGLVEQERSGRNLIYCTAFERMNALIGFLTAHCCGGQPCTDTPAACEPSCAPKKTRSVVPRKLPAPIRAGTKSAASRKPSPIPTQRGSK